MNEREAKLTILLGATGTGKTSILNKIVLEVKQRTLICTPDDIEWQQYEKTELLKPSDFEFSGVRRFIFDAYSKRVAFDNLARTNCFADGILIFDDCRMYFKANEQYNEVYRKYFGRKRQNKRDVFVVGHGFTEIPPIFFTFATDMILFKTTDKIARRMNCINHYEKICELQEEVNAKAEKQPHFYKIFKFK